MRSFSRFGCTKSVEGRTFVNGDTSFKSSISVDGDLEVTSGDIGLLGGYLPVAELEECRSPGMEMLAPIGHKTDGLDRTARSSEDEQPNPNPHGRPHVDVTSFVGV